MLLTAVRRAVSDDWISLDDIGPDAEPLFTRWGHGDRATA